MSIFDEFNDPLQFEASGGLFGRLLSLQPGQSFGSSVGQVQSANRPDAAVTPGNPAGPQTAAPVAQPEQSHPQLPSAWQPPDYGQTQNIRIGNYGMPQFGRAEPQQPMAPPDLGDRLSAGFQSWAHTPVGNPFAALANGITGVSTGQRVVQPTTQQGASSQSDPVVTPAGTIPSSPRIPISRRRYGNGR
jgi:hypothetical protein